MLKSFLSFGAIALGFLLLSPVATVIEASRDNCRCLTFEEMNGIDEFTELSNVNGTMEGDVSQTYGVGCGAHYKSGSLFCEDEEYCDYQWCFVNSQNCKLQHSPSNIYPFLSYSYAACGYIDTFKRDPGYHLQNGVVLQGVYKDNHRGYEGTICDQKDGPNSCYGTVVDLVDQMFLRSNVLNISFNIISVPESVTKRAESYGPFLENDENMDYGACVYAASLGVVDLCIGAFTKNRQRAAISSYLEMGVTSEYLVVRDVPVDNTLKKMIVNVFAPFHLSLWFVTFAVLFLLSLLFLVQEHSWSELRETHIYDSAGLATYNAVLGFFSQGYVTEGDPSSWGGRFTLLAIAVQILLTGAAYTANLTNFLVRGSSSSTVESLDEAIQKELKVCVLRNKISVLNSTYDNIQYAINPDTELLGFEKRTELLPAMDEGICSCAVISRPELDDYHGKGKHCDKKFVGIPVIELPWGIPVSDRFAATLNTVLTGFMQTGGWAKIQKKAKPENKCGRDPEFDAETTALEPEHMLGAYMLSGLLATTGIIVSLVVVAKKRRTKSQSKRMKVSKSTEQNSESYLGKMEINDEEMRTPPSGIEKYEDINTSMTSLRTEIADLKQIVLSGQKKGSVPCPKVQPISFANEPLVDSL